MSKPWFKQDASSSPATDGTLPDRVSVVIVGAELVGLALATFLARKGVQVLVLEPRSQVGLGCTARSPGFVTLGLTEHPWRWEASLGAEKASQLLETCLRNQTLVKDNLSFHEAGGLWVAALDGEEVEIEKDVAMLARHGVSCEHWDSSRVNKALGSQGLGSGRFMPQEGLLWPAEALATLAQQARDNGARIATGVDYLSRSRCDTDLMVQTSMGAVKSDVLVFANGALAPTSDPYFEEKITPVRQQMVIFEGEEPAVCGPGAHGQHGYAFFRPLPGHARRLLVGGCRWATPHMEVGETDDSVCEARVDARIVAFAHKHLPWTRKANVIAGWSGLMGFSCDGLPLVGNLPGDPRCFVCVGFGGREHSFGMLAAHSIAQALLDEASDGLPDFFNTWRLV